MRLASRRLLRTATPERICSAGVCMREPWLLPLATEAARRPGPRPSLRIFAAWALALVDDVAARTTSPVMRKPSAPLRRAPELSAALPGDTTAAAGEASADALNARRDGDRAAATPAVECGGACAGAEMRRAADGGAVGEAASSGAVSTRASGAAPTAVAAALTPMASTGPGRGLGSSSWPAANEGAAAFATAPGTAPKSSASASPAESLAASAADGAPASAPGSAGAAFSPAPSPSATAKPTLSGGRAGAAAAAADAVLPGSACGAATDLAASLCNGGRGAFAAWAA